MNVAKVLLLAVLALPVLELVAFGAVAAAVGFPWAFLLLVAGSCAGVLVLRHAGGNHIARMRVAMAEGSISSLTADTTGGLVLLAGFLLLVPGFITDVGGLSLLLVALFRGRRPPPKRPDGVIDLDPEQWHQVPEPALRDGRDHDRRPG
jgi:UPF0716 protein FxsA